jgi:uncharacterized protein YcfL
MKRTLTIVMLLAAAVAAGCGGKAAQKDEPKSAFGCPMAYPGATMEKLIAAKVSTAGTVNNVKVTEMRCRIQGELLRIDATISNEASNARHISYRFSWLDEQGFKAWDDEAWKPVMIYEGSSISIVSTAPTRKATDFHMELLDQDSH